jgi:hypothetical protein
MSLVERLANALAPHKPEERRMFSGTGFMLNCNLVIATTKRGLLVRVGAAAEEKAIARPHATVMEMRGHKMPGWIIVEPGGFESDGQLKNWVAMALAFNKTLPPKKTKPPRKSAAKAPKKK